jgi:hypothetical protein
MSTTGATPTVGVAVGFSQGFSCTITGGTVAATVGTLEVAFVVPVASTITSLAGSFTYNSGANLTATDVTITVQVYSAPEGSSTFTPVAGTAVNLGVLTSTSVQNDVLSEGVTGLSIPVAAGTRLMFLGTATAVGATPNQSPNGKFSGSMVLQ